jgi:4-amino-4-deoxy-L-arabinose transferase-like glycosyltransferase
VIVLGASLALLVAAGIRLAGVTAAADESRATRALRAAIWAFAILVVVEATLGACGRLEARATFVALAVVAAAVALGTRGRAPHGTVAARAPLTTLDVAYLTALGAALLLRAWAGIHKTTFLYDTLAYHLHVPASWIAARRLEIVPAVFGDPSSAYAPSNLELWFAFLMAPLRSDYLAGSGQLPFAALAALAIVGAVREAGGQRTAALAAALAFLLVPEIWQQARTAMTDLGMAALLLAALPFVFRLRRRASAGDLLTAAAALGLAVGTKYVALPLAAPFALALGLAAARGRARPRGMAATGLVLLATGGFWFLRNLVLAGNPFYPVATLGLPGLYDRAAMRAWDYHLPVQDVAALGGMLVAAGVGFGLVAMLVLIARRPRPEIWILTALLAIFWFWVPYQESRFLFAAFGVAAVAVGRASARPTGELDWRVGALLLAGLVDSPTLERWLIVPAGLVGGGAALAWHRVPERRRRPLLIGGLTALLVGGTLALVVGFDHYRARDPGYTVGGDLDAAWVWFRANVRGARVAYAGTNLAFPLAGRDLANRVAYVNVAGAPDDRLHDFAARAPATGRAATPEPAPYRDGASFDVWLRNLRAPRAGVLFVAVLDEIVARNVTADGDGFPVERAWADAHPTLFHLRYASPAARVYEIAP